MFVPHYSITCEEEENCYTFKVASHGHAIVFGHAKTSCNTSCKKNATSCCKGLSLQVNTICCVSLYKLLGVALDKNINFKSHVNQLCRKAGQKLHALARISNYIHIGKLKIMMMNTCIISQFSYCPLIWMFHDRSVNKKISRIHEKALRIAYKDSCSSYEDMLRKSESVTIHQRNLKLLAMEIYKTLL